jgi:lipopolysaccharide/colanic/teichoic acid biosynthesis glycosyltransferase
VKKNLAAFRYSDQKVVPLYASEAVRGSYSEAATPADARPLEMACKRAIDVLFALAVMLLGLPFYGLIALLIKDGRPFKFYKFRTMLVDNSDAAHRSFAAEFIKGRLMHDDEAKKPVFKLQNDPRVTPIGRFLRKSSLDELPQFINVFKGDMTLVGPRPPLAYELAHYKEWHRGRLAVKPGLTGLWQVSGRSTVPFDEMVMLDLYYIENWSLALDLKIILRTVPVMLFGFGGY